MNEIQISDRSSIEDNCIESQFMKKNRIKTSNSVITHSHLKRSQSGSATFFDPGDFLYYSDIGFNTQTGDFDLKFSPLSDSCWCARIPTPGDPH